MRIGTLWLKANGRSAEGVSKSRPMVGVQGHCVDNWRSKVSGCEFALDLNVMRGNKGLTIISDSHRCELTNIESGDQWYWGQATEGQRSEQLTVTETQESKDLWEISKEKVTRKKHHFAGKRKYRKERNECGKKRTFVKNIWEKNNEEKTKKWRKKRKKTKGKEI